MQITKESEVGYTNSRQGRLYLKKKKLQEPKDISYSNKRFYTARRYNNYKHLCM